MITRKIGKKVREGITDRTIRYFKLGDEERKRDRRRRRITRKIGEVREGITDRTIRYFKLGDEERKRDRRRRRSEFYRLI